MLLLIKQLILSRRRIIYCEGMIGVFLLFSVTAPLSRGAEVTKTFLETAEIQPPPYLRSRGVYTTYGDEGYKWYNIVEIDDKHVSEGFTEIMKRTVPLDGIEGLKIRVEILKSMRGVQVTLSNAKRGEEPGGSFSKTSRAAPAICPDASASARSHATRCRCASAISATRAKRASICS